MHVRGARILLTGATGGLGSAAARVLAARGARLVLSGRRADALEALAAELDGEIETVAADLSDPEAAVILARAAEPVDVLVANAALDVSERLQELAAEEIERAITVNLLVPALLARELVPPMTARGGGHLVFVSSIAGKAATPGNGPLYTATKFALRGLALSLREDLEGSGIGVSAIFPGPVSGAGMFARTEEKLPPGISTRSPEQVAAGIVRAIERNRAEVDVASLAMRMGGWIAGFAPLLPGRIGRRSGAATIRRRMVDTRPG